MGIEIIGKNVAALRKERGVLQETLADAVGVSAQAVSKWENGGAPDAELLPAIADFFGVSVDSLFGRSGGGDVSAAIAEKIDGAPWEEKVKTAFELCLVMQKAMFNGKTPLEILNDRFTGMFSRYGTSFGSLDERLPFFIVAPETEEKSAHILDGIDYPAFFAGLGNNKIFDAVIFVLRRPDMTKQFTSRLLVRELGMTDEESAEAIGFMKKYQLVRSSLAEIDDVTEEIFCVERDNPSFVLMLTLARSVIVPPCSWSCLNGGREKNWLA